MNKKGVVVGILLVCLWAAVVPATTGITQKQDLSSTLSIDQLDQHCEPDNLGWAFEPDRNPRAQSFQPTFDTFTRVDLPLRKEHEPNGTLKVSLRSSLDGPALASQSRDLVDIPSSEYPDFTWIEFDFPVITMVPDTTYFIHAELVNGSEWDGWNILRWMATFNDTYPYGCEWAYYIPSQSWEQYLSDMGFRTYGIDPGPPQPITISGPHYGKVDTEYTFEVGPITNPEGDDFFCMVDWGDGSYSDWLGPFHAGQTVSLTHAWSEPGNYSIKAKIKDPWGVESDWSAPFYIEIVPLKTKLSLGTFESISQTEDLTILHTRLVFVFPSIPMFCRGGILVLSKEYQGYIGTRVILGVGGTAVI